MRHLFYGSLCHMAEVFGRAESTRKSRHLTPASILKPRRSSSFREFSCSCRFWRAITHGYRSRRTQEMSDLRQHQLKSLRESGGLAA